VYIAFVLVVVVAAFFEKSMLIYVKPIAIVAIMVLYVTSVSGNKILFPLSMIIIIANDSLVLIDFLKYFKVITILISTFYFLCILQLRKYIAREDLKTDRLLSYPALIGMALVFYLIYSIAQLTLPTLDGLLNYVLVIIFGVLAFSTPCFIVYISDRYKNSIYLFVAASCSILVDMLLAINEFFYYDRVFTVLINMGEIIGIYFFASFFIETQLKQMSDNKPYF